jgi:SAM-dependent methyltransferase
MARLPNRVKFFLAAGFLERVNPRLAGDPYGRLTEHFPGNANRVLEICAGTGYASRRLIQAGLVAETVALDASPELVNAGREIVAASGIPVYFVLADVARMPFGDNAFDVVVSTFALHELPHSVRLAALHEITRVLSPTGTLVVVDIDLPAKWRRLFRTYLYLSHGSSAAPVLGSGLRRMLEREGMTVHQRESGLGRLLAFQVVTASPSHPTRTRAAQGVQGLGGG